MAAECPSAFVAAPPLPPVNGIVAEAGMSLVPLEQLIADLACPCCGAPVAGGADYYRCTRLGCGRSYPVIGQQPVLVDFDESILIEEDMRISTAGSNIRRGSAGRIKRRIVQSLLPINRAAPMNADRFVELAQALSDRPKILIVGGGSAGAGTKELYANPALQLISFDIYGSELTQFVADAHQMPL